MKEITELVFVLDRSGSMETLTSETIGGFNSLINKQKAESNDDEVYVTTILFDDKSEVLHDHKRIEDIPRLTENEYYARGCTALLDAVGNTIKKVSKNIKSMPLSQKTSKVLFVITTDGYENASTVFSKSKVKKLISKHQEKDNWTFLFLGANIDAISEADSIGIRKSGAIRPSASIAGVKSSFEAINDIAYCMRNADCADRNYSAKMQNACVSRLRNVR